MNRFQPQQTSHAGGNEVLTSFQRERARFANTIIAAAVESGEQPQGDFLLQQQHQQNKLKQKHQQEQLILRNAEAAANAQKGGEVFIQSTTSENNESSAATTSDHLRNLLSFPPSRMSVTRLPQCVRELEDCIELRSETWFGLMEAKKQMTLYSAKLHLLINKNSSSQFGQQEVEQDDEAATPMTTIETCMDKIRTLKQQVTSLHQQFHYLEDRISKLRSELELLSSEGSTITTVSEQANLAETPEPPAPFNEVFEKNKHIMMLNNNANIMMMNNKNKSVLGDPSSARMVKRGLGAGSKAFSLSLDGSSSPPFRQSSSSFSFIGNNSSLNKISLVDGSTQQRRNTTSSSSTSSSPYSSPTRRMLSSSVNQQPPGRLQTLINVADAEKLEMERHHQARERIEGVSSSDSKPKGPDIFTLASSALRAKQAAASASSPHAGGAYALSKLPLLDFLYLVMKGNAQLNMRPDALRASELVLRVQSRYRQRRIRKKFHKLKKLRRFFDRDCLRRSFDAWRNETRATQASNYLSVRRAFRAWNGVVSVSIVKKQNFGFIWRKLRDYGTKYRVFHVWHRYIRYLNTDSDKELGLRLISFDKQLDPWNDFLKLEDKRRELYKARSGIKSLFSFGIKKKREDVDEETDNWLIEKKYWDTWVDFVEEEKKVVQSEIMAENYIKRRTLRKHFSAWEQLAAYTSNLIRRDRALKTFYLVRWKRFVMQEKLEREGVKQFRRVHKLRYLTRWRRKAVDVRRRIAAHITVLQNNRRLSLMAIYAWKGEKTNLCFLECWKEWQNYVERRKVWKAFVSSRLTVHNHFLKSVVFAGWVLATPSLAAQFALAKQRRDQNVNLIAGDERLSDFTEELKSTQFRVRAAKLMRRINTLETEEKLKLKDFHGSIQEFRKKEQQDKNTSAQKAGGGGAGENLSARDQILQMSSGGGTTTTTTSLLASVVGERKETEEEKEKRKLQEEEQAEEKRRKEEEEEWKLMSPQERQQKLSDEAKKKAEALIQKRRELQEERIMATCMATAKGASQSIMNSFEHHVEQWSLQELQIEQNNVERNFEWWLQSGDEQQQQQGGNVNTNPAADKTLSFAVLHLLVDFVYRNWILPRKRRRANALRISASRRVEGGGGGGVGENALESYGGVNNNASSTSGTTPVHNNSNNNNNNTNELVSPSAAAAIAGGTVSIVPPSTTSVTSPTKGMTTTEKKQFLARQHQVYLRRETFALGVVASCGMPFIQLGPHQKGAFFSVGSVESFITSQGKTLQARRVRDERNHSRFLRKYLSKEAALKLYMVSHTFSCSLRQVITPWRMLMESSKPSKVNKNKRVVPSVSPYALLPSWTPSKAAELKAKEKPRAATAIFALRRTLNEEIIGARGNVHCEFHRFLELQVARACALRELAFLGVNTSMYGFSTLKPEQMAKREYQLVSIPPLEKEMTLSTERIKKRIKEVAPHQIVNPVVVDYKLMEVIGFTPNSFNMRTLTRLRDRMKRQRDELKEAYEKAEAAIAERNATPQEKKFRQAQQQTATKATLQMGLHTTKSFSAFSFRPGGQGSPGGKKAGGGRFARMNKEASFSGFGNMLARDADSFGGAEAINDEFLQSHPLIASPTAVFGHDTGPNAAHRGVHPSVLARQRKQAAIAASGGRNRGVFLVRRKSSTKLHGGAEGDHEGEEHEEEQDDEIDSDDDQEDQIPHWMLVDAVDDPTVLFDAQNRKAPTTWRVGATSSHQRKQIRRDNEDGATSPEGENDENHENHEPNPEDEAIAALEHEISMSNRLDYVDRFVQDPGSDEDDEENEEAAAQRRLEEEEAENAKATTILSDFPISCPLFQRNRERLVYSESVVKIPALSRYQHRRSTTKEEHMPKWDQEALEELERKEREKKEAEEKAKEEEEKIKFYMRQQEERKNVFDMENALRKSKIEAVEERERAIDLHEGFVDLKQTCVRILREMAAERERQIEEERVAEEERLERQAQARREFEALEWEREQEKKALYEKIAAELGFMEGDYAPLPEAVFVFYKPVEPSSYALDAEELSEFSEAGEGEEGIRTGTAASSSSSKRPGTAGSQHSSSSSSSVPGSRPGSSKGHRTTPDHQIVVSSGRVSSSSNASSRLPHSRPGSAGGDNNNNNYPPFSQPFPIGDGTTNLHVLQQHKSGREPKHLGETGALTESDDDDYDEETARVRRQQRLQEAERLQAIRVTLSSADSSTTPSKPQTPAATQPTLTHKRTQGPVESGAEDENQPDSNPFDPSPSKKVEAALAAANSSIASIILKNAGQVHGALGDEEDDEGLDPLAKINRDKLKRIDYSNAAKALEQFQNEMKQLIPQRVIQAKSIVVFDDSEYFEDVVDSQEDDDFEIDPETGERKNKKKDKKISRKLKIKFRKVDDANSGAGSGFQPAILATELKAMPDPRVFLDRKKDASNKDSAREKSRRRADTLLSLGKRKSPLNSSSSSSSSSTSIPSPYSVEQLHTRKRNKEEEEEEEAKWVVFPRPPSSCDPDPSAYGTLYQVMEKERFLLRFKNHGSNSPRSSSSSSSSSSCSPRQTVRATQVMFELTGKRAEIASEGASFAIEGLAEEIRQHVEKLEKEREKQLEEEREEKRRKKRAKKEQQQNEKDPQEQQKEEEKEEEGQRQTPPPPPLPELKPEETPEKQIPPGELLDDDNVVNALLDQKLLLVSTGRPHSASTGGGSATTRTTTTAASSSPSSTPRPPPKTHNLLLSPARGVVDSSSSSSSPTGTAGGGGVGGGEASPSSSLFALTERDMSVIRTLERRNIRRTLGQPYLNALANPLLRGPAAASSSSNNNFGNKRAGGRRTIKTTFSNSAATPPPFSQQSVLGRHHGGTTSQTPQQPFAHMTAAVNRSLVLGSNNNTLQQELHRIQVPHLFIEGDEDEDEEYEEYEAEEEVEEEEEEEENDDEEEWEYYEEEEEVEEEIEEEKEGETSETQQKERDEKTRQSRLVKKLVVKKRLVEKVEEGEAEKKIKKKKKVKIVKKKMMIKKRKKKKKEKKVIAGIPDVKQEQKQKQDISEQQSLVRENLSRMLSTADLINKHLAASF